MEANGREAGRVGGHEESIPLVDVNGAVGGALVENEAFEDTRGPKIGSARILLGGKYDLELGKLSCNCLRRKWKFCPQIKALAGGKITPELLVSNEIGKNHEGRILIENQRKLRLVDPVMENLGVGGSSDKEGKIYTRNSMSIIKNNKQDFANLLNAFVSNQMSTIQQDQTCVENNRLNNNCSMSSSSVQVVDKNMQLINKRDQRYPVESRSQMNIDLSLGGIDLVPELQNQQNSMNRKDILESEPKPSLLDFGFSQIRNSDSTKINIFGSKKGKRKKGKDVLTTKQTNLEHYLSTDMVCRRTVKAKRIFAK